MSDPQRSAGTHPAQESDSQPLVTIVVPAYNRAGGLLEDTLDSILAQDYPNVEVLVLDDGSTDQTPQVLERYAAAHPERLRWERHENMGQPRTLNRGFEMARGELIGYLNSDDLFLPGAITKLVAVLVADPEAALAYPAYRIIKGEEAEEMADMVPPEYTVAEAVRLHNCIVNVGAIFRRRVVERIGGWDPSFTYLADFDWCVRANSVGHFLRHPEVLACWRNHPGSANYAPGLEAAREQTRLLDKIYSADDLGEDVLEVRDEAYRNAFIVAAFAMGGVNRADGRFFIHDTLAARGLVQDARDRRRDERAHAPADDEPRAAREEPRHDGGSTAGRGAARRAALAERPAPRHATGAPSRRAAGPRQGRPRRRRAAADPEDRAAADQVRSAAEPREERPDAEAESLRRTVAELAALERRLRTELETERGSHQADVSRLEAEIEAQGTRLAERNLENRELRGQLKALRGKRARSIRHRIARLPPVAGLLARRRRAAGSARADLDEDRPRR